MPTNVGPNINYVPIPGNTYGPAINYSPTPHYASISGTVEGGPLPENNYSPGQLASTGFNLLPDSVTGNFTPSFTRSGIKTSILNGVDQFGGSLGFAAPQTLPAGFVGPPQMNPGFFGSGATLGNVLGGAGVGSVIGGLNLFGGKQQGSSIGGTIGGAAGAFLPIPGGTIIGSAIGSAIGGMFGGTPMNASQFLLPIGADMDFSNLSFGSKGIDEAAAQSVASEFSNYLTTLNSNFGLDFSGTSAFGGYNDKYEDGFFLRTHRDEGSSKDLRFKFSPDDDPNSTIAAFQGLAIEMLRDKEALTPEIEAQIRGYNPNDNQAGGQHGFGGGGQARSLEGIPLVGAGAALQRTNYQSFRQQYLNKIAKQEEGNV